MSEQSARSMSSTVIDSLETRSTSERLHTVFVNSSGKLRVHFERFLHQSTRKNGLKVRQRLSICQFVCSFCLFSLKRSEHATNHFAVNLQMLGVDNRARGGFSISQWLCCSRFMPIAHASR
jgi:hypothetical protein